MPDASVSGGRRGLRQRVLTTEQRFISTPQGPAKTDGKMNTRRGGTHYHVLYDLFI